MNVAARAGTVRSIKNRSTVTSARTLSTTCRRDPGEKIGSDSDSGPDPNYALDWGSDLDYVSDSSPDSDSDTDSGSISDSGPD